MLKLPNAIACCALILLTACDFSDDHHGSSPERAYFHLRVDFPSNQISPAFIDPRAEAMIIELYPWPHAPYESIITDTEQINLFQTCLAELSDSQNCSLKPGDLLASVQLTTHQNNWSIDLDTGTYLLQVQQLAEANNPSSRFSVTTSLLNLAAGQNNVVINLTAGRWQFATPIELQLLGQGRPFDLLTEYFPGAESNRPGLSSYTSWTSELTWILDSRSEYAESHPPTTAAVALGLAIDDVNFSFNPVKLHALHLTGEQGLQGWQQLVMGTQSEDELSLYYGSNTGESLPANLLTWRLNTPSAITFETQQNGTPFYFHHHWQRIEEFEGPFHGQMGVRSPSQLRQAYTQGLNQTHLSLGELVVQKTPNSESRGYQAGIFFLTPETLGSLSLRALAGDSGEIITADGGYVFQQQDEEDLGSGISRLNLDVRLEELFIDPEFPPGQPPLTQMINANTIHGTLVEFVHFRDSEADPLSEYLGVAFPSFATLAPDHTGTERDSIQQRVLRHLSGQARPGEIVAASQMSSSGCYTYYDRRIRIEQNYGINPDTQRWEADGSEQIDETHISSLPPDAYETEAGRVCLHPFTLTATPLSSPIGMIQPLATDIAPITQDTAAQLAFEVIDVNGDNLKTFHTLAELILFVMEEDICSSGQTVMESLGSQELLRRIQFNACILKPDFGGPWSNNQLDGEIRVRAAAWPSNPEPEPVLMRIESLDLTQTAPDNARTQLQGRFEATHQAGEPTLSYLSGAYFSMRLLNAQQPMWQSWQHFHWDLSETVTMGSLHPRRPRYYLGRNQPLAEHGGAFAVTTLAPFMGNEPAPFRPESGQVSVEGAEKTWMEVTLSSGDIIQIQGHLITENGLQNCQLSSDWDALNSQFDANPPALSWSCNPL
ncbi:hypothetical protein V6U78_07590 [Marinospirillum sp. MEB164]|uniref:EF-hand domain-containing protein n=1 Tax=Marinospirillum alkalitolerans TaxID=3123374 RepID=A0ABW8PYH8_9GAMM